MDDAQGCSRFGDAIGDCQVSIVCLYRTIVKDVCCGNGYQFGLVLHREIKNGNHDLRCSTRQMQAFSHYRLQSFAQLYRQVISTLLRLVESGLNGVVLHLELLEDACAFLVCLVGQCLTGTDFIGFASHNGKNGRNTRSFGLEVAEQRSQISQTTSLAQPFSKLQERFVGIGTEQVAEFLYLDSGCFCKGFGLGVHLHEDVLISRSGCFLAKHVLVHGSGKTENVSLCDSGLMCCARHTSGKVHQERLCCTTVLCHLVDSRTGSQHSSTHAFGLVLAKHHGQLTDVLHGILAQVFTECHIDFVGSVHEFEYLVFRLDTQTTCITGQCVQLFTGGSCVHLLEVLVQALDFITCHACVFGHLAHCFVHLGEGLDFT